MTHRRRPPIPEDAVFDPVEIDKWLETPAPVRPDHAVAIDDQYIKRLEEITDRLDELCDDRAMVPVDMVLAIVGELDDIQIYFTRAQHQQRHPKVMPFKKADDHGEVPRSIRRLSDDT